MKEIKRFNCGVGIFEEELCCTHPGSACTPHLVYLQGSEVRLRQGHVTPRMKIRASITEGKADWGWRAREFHLGRWFIA